MCIILAQTISRLDNVQNNDNNGANGYTLWTVKNGTYSKKKKKDIIAKENYKNGRN